MSDAGRSSAGGNTDRGGRADGDRHPVAEEEPPYEPVTRAGGYGAGDEFAEHLDIARMSMGPNGAGSVMSAGWLAQWATARAAFKAGRWAEASRDMARLENLGLRGLGDMREAAVDGPCVALQAFMRKYGGAAPPGWPGYRTLGAF